MGKAGIPAYHLLGWAPLPFRHGGAYQRTGTTRYCAATVLDYEKSQAAPLHYDRAYSEEEIWDNFTYLIQRIMPVAEESGVRITMDLASYLPNLNVDPDHISQVFLNIIQNALQAMPDGGTLNIVTTYNDHYGLHLKGGDDSKDTNGYVEIAFSDTGIGIAQENLEKLFEPFFTTRSKGTGLGLAISYRIVKEHGGTIQVQSETGKGTTFVVYLPGHSDQGEDNS